MRKSYQKKLTNLLKNANKHLKNDDLMLGRFYIMQREAQWISFDDKSGGILFATLRCYDRETESYKDYMYRFAPYFSGNYWHLYMDIINDFIVNVVKWDLRRPPIDYRNFEYIKNDERPSRFHFYDINEEEIKGKIGRAHV